jgi:hypothetical protein
MSVPTIFIPSLKLGNVGWVGRGALVGCGFGVFGRVAIRVGETVGPSVAAIVGVLLGTNVACGTFVVVLGICESIRGVTVALVGTLCADGDGISVARTIQPKHANTTTPAAPSTAMITHCVLVIGSLLAVQMPANKNACAA